MQAQALDLHNPFSTAREQFETLLDRLNGSECREMSHSQLEQVIKKDGREVLRCLLQGHLDLRGDAEAMGPVVSANDDGPRKRGRRRTRHIESIFGRVSVDRHAYVERGQASLFVLDGYLNLPPELYSFGLRHKVALEAAKVSFEEVVMSVEEATGVKLPKRQAEELAQRTAVDFDAFYERRAAADVADNDELIVISTDGKGISMRTDHLRDATRKAALKRKPKLDKRRSKGEKSATRRMAQVAAVYSIARFERSADDIVGELGSTKEPAPPRKPTRPKPHNKRVWASVQKDSWDVIDEAFAEAKRLDPEREKHWVALVDGGPDQLEGVLECIGRAGCKVTVILDIIHVLEYLWGAANALLGEGKPETQAWVTKRLRGLLEGKDISQMAAGIRRSATMRGLSKSRRKPADKCADYLLRYANFMAYDEALAAGLPISTGVIEGACRYLVRDRMDITGARWTVEGAEAVLRLRAVRASGDFDEYWSFHEARELRRNHLAKYANETLPHPRPTTPEIRSGSHLRLVS